MIRRLRERCREPEFLLRLNRALKWFWIALVPVVEFVPGLKTNVNIVILLSLYANMATNWSAERALEAELSTNGDEPAAGA